MRTAELARRHFPHLRILARVRNRQHAYEMMGLGLDDVVRDTRHSSLELARRVLQTTGLEVDEAARRVEVCRAFDQRTLEAQHAFHEDEPRLLQSAREAARELEQLFGDDHGELNTATAKVADDSARAGLQHADERRDRDA